MAAVRGKDFKLYRNTGNTNTPTWTEVTNVRDVTRNLELALADASIRGSSFKQQVGTMKDLSLDTQMVYDQADAAYTAFEDSFFNATTLDLLVLDGSIATVNNKGLRFEAQVTTFSVNEGLEDVGLTDVTVVPAYSTTNPPRRVNVANANTVTNTA
jgi:hypothetical protein